jgi:hypothetical protein
MTILPLTMMVLSFVGVLSSVGRSPLGAAFWMFGAAFSISIGRMLPLSRRVSYSADTATFSVKGSWMPLAVMMTIFFTKYIVSVMVALQLPLASSEAFIPMISLCYGLFSGYFLMSLLALLRSAKLGNSRFKL